jgi:hypothetical protein
VVAGRVLEQGAGAAFCTRGYRLGVAASDHGRAMDLGISLAKFWAASGISWYRWLDSTCSAQHVQELSVNLGWSAQYQTQFKILRSCHPIKRSIAIGIETRGGYLQGTPRSIMMYSSFLIKGDQISRINGLRPSCMKFPVFTMRYFEEHHYQIHSFGNKRIIRLVSMETQDFNL